VPEVQTLEEVLAVLSAKGAKRIGVDGTDGAGKSDLATRISAALRIPHLDLDDVLEKNQGGFINHIKYGELRRAAPEAGFVISGVCLLDVLERAEIAIEALVYVKMYHLGYWSDERELDVMEPLEQFLVAERVVLSQIENRPVTDFGLGEEIIKYHYHRRPFNRSDVVFRRNIGAENDG
jgi:hypothetical protein